MANRPLDTVVVDPQLRIVWLEICTAKYVVKFPRYRVLKAQLLMCVCVCQLNGQWSKRDTLSKAELAVLGAKLDREIVAASKKGQLWAWILLKLDERD